MLGVEKYLSIFSENKSNLYIMLHYSIIMYNFMPIMAYCALKSNIIKVYHYSNS